MEAGLSEACLRWSFWTWGGDSSTFSRTPPIFKISELFYCCTHLLNPHRCLLLHNRWILIFAWSFLYSCQQILFPLFTLFPSTFEPRTKHTIPPTLRNCWHLESTCFDDCCSHISSESIFQWWGSHEGTCLRGFIKCEEEVLSWFSQRIYYEADRKDLYLTVIV